jgi:hypothetical protein
MLFGSQEFIGKSDIILRDKSLFKGDLYVLLDSIVSIVLPDSLEMWLERWELAELMWVYHIFHSDDFWSTERKGFILILEKFSTLFSVVSILI